MEEPAQNTPQFASVAHHVLNRHMFVIVGILVIGVLLGAAFSPWSLVSKQGKTPTTFTVTGTGIAEAAPDTVTLTVNSINKQFSTMQEATDYAKKQTEEVKSKLAIFNLSQSSLIIYSNVSPDYQVISTRETFIQDPTPSQVQSDSPKKASLVSGVYNSSISVNIYLRNEQQKSLDKITQVLKGMDTIEFPMDPQYSASLTQEMQKQAREKALEDARNQAEQIASINKVRIGRIVKIADLSQRDGYVEPIGSPIILNMGDQKVKYSLSYEVVYEMH